MSAQPTPPAEDPYHGQPPARFKCMKSYVGDLCTDRTCLAGCQRVNTRYGEAPPPPVVQPEKEPPAMKQDAKQAELPGAGADVIDHPSAAGRRGSDGQEQAPNTEALQSKLKGLTKAYNDFMASKEELSTKVKKAGEASGFNAAAIKKLLKSNYEGAETVADKKREAEQLVLLFDKLGETE